MNLLDLSRFFRQSLLFRRHFVGPILTMLVYVGIVVFLHLFRPIRLVLVGRQLLFSLLLFSWHLTYVCLSSWQPVLLLLPVQPLLVSSFVQPETVHRQRKRPQINHHQYLIQFSFLFSSSICKWIIFYPPHLRNTSIMFEALHTYHLDKIITVLNKYYLTCMIF